jgi:uncharacterized integral membrane protein
MTVTVAPIKRRRTDPPAATPSDIAAPVASGSRSVDATGTGPVAPQPKSSVAWLPLAGVMALVVLVLVFILQNLKTVRVSFFTVDWRIPLALDLLFAAVLGGLIVMAVISLRNFQRRRAARRHARGATDGPGART